MSLSFCKSSLFIAGIRDCGAFKNWSGRRTLFEGGWVGQPSLIFLSKLENRTETLAQDLAGTKKELVVPPNAIS